MDSGKSLPAAISSPKHQTPFNGLSPSFQNSKKITKGMAELNSFGFKTSVTHADPSLLLLFRSHCPLNLGFHVSDLWSQRQQQEFLKTMKLERAQLAREREASFINFLVASKKKPANFSQTGFRPSVVHHETDREAMNKYKYSIPAMNKQSKSHPILPALKPAPQLLDDLIGQCDNTLASFNEHKKLALTPRATGKMQEDVLEDSARSLRLGGKRFANRMRK
jgi:hypothetical protein